MSCSTCGYEPAPSGSSEETQTSVSAKFCRRCGTRLSEDGREKRAQPLVSASMAKSSVSAPPRKKNLWRDFQESRRGDTHTALIAAMWLLTLAALMSLVALEENIGRVLDLVAVILALILVFLPAKTDRINGWMKIGIEVINVVVLFLLNVRHR